MRVENQSETEAFLRAEIARLDDCQAVKTVETHISLVFIARTLAWKLKKAVRLPYLNFETADLRLALCERELELNRRTAPELYRRVRKVARASNGLLSLDGQGTLVDAFLEMKRFDQDRLLDRMARRGDLSSPLITRLAGILAGFHARAKRHPGSAGSGSGRVDAVLRINEAGLAAARELFGDAPVQELVDATRSLWQRHRPLLDERQRDGKVRITHGDLHLRNIVDIDGEPTLFDCLEFDAEMATTDILYDLAFLLMDLWHRNLWPLANLLFNRYLDAGDETGGLALLPLFLSIRATVRSHVLATQAVEGGGDEAVARESRTYLDLAATLLRPQSTSLIAIGGFSGTGKSTAAATVAAEVGVPPGARILSSDRIRKRLHGVEPETRLPVEAYRPEISARVYAVMRQEAEAVLSTGHSAIVDAVFDRQTDRDELEAVARANGIAFHGLWLEAPEDTLIDRIERRRGDPSDATAEVVRAQLKRDLGTMGWQRIEAGGDRTLQNLRSAAQIVR